ncbi:MAG: 7-carboxy-7-deazaguanine synthase QueE [Elusimicrobiales bacterium]
MIYAKVSEIFDSFQGEGLFVGQKHIFVRFYGCNLRCSYCDESTKKWKKMSVFNVVEKIKSLLNKTDVISFTGGEPLLYSDFISNVIKDLGLNHRYLLETNATLPQSFIRIRKMIDIISADIKLPQYCGKALWDEHISFLNLSKGKTLYVKLVFDLDVSLSDFRTAVDCVSKVDRKIPFFIQPDSRLIIDKRIVKLIEKLYNIAYEKLFDIRFLPQIHKIFGFR